MGTATVGNVGAWKQPHQWRNPRNSWKDAPRGYRALLAVGRTTPHQPQVSEEELASLEAEFPAYAANPSLGHLSVSQRLDLVATSLLAAAMHDITGHEDKKDILTVYKAQARASRELLVPDPAIFDGYDHHIDRRMRDKTNQWWGLGVPA